MVVAAEIGQLEDILRFNLMNDLPRLGLKIGDDVAEYLTNIAKFGYLISTLFQFMPSIISIIIIISSFITVWLVTRINIKFYEMAINFRVSIEVIILEKRCDP